MHALSTERGFTAAGAMASGVQGTGSWSCREKQPVSLGLTWCHAGRVAHSHTVVWAPGPRPSVTTEPRISPRGPCWGALHAMVPCLGPVPWSPHTFSLLLETTREGSPGVGRTAPASPKARVPCCSQTRPCTSWEHHVYALHAHVAGTADGDSQTLLGLLAPNHTTEVSV